MLELDFSIIGPAMPLLLRGMTVTLKITAVGIFVGIVWGTVLAVMRTSPIKIVSFFAKAYVNVFRSIPLVMVLMWFYLLVPQLFKMIPAYFASLTANTFAAPLFSAISIGAAEADIRLVSAIIAFALFEAAYYSEIIRSGMNSVSSGQHHAALALGMTRLQSLRFVVLPQAFRVMTPLLLTQGIILFQDTALVYIMGLADFFRTANMLGKNMGQVEELTMVMFAGFGYFIICFTVSVTISYFKKRIN